MFETPGAWTLSAKCAGMGDEFFGDTQAKQKMVRRFCIDCPVRQECLRKWNVVPPSVSIDGRV